MPNLNPLPALPGTKSTAVNPAAPAANERLSATEANQITTALANLARAIGAVDDGTIQTVAAYLGSLSSQITGLAPVATTGAYTSLTGRPTLSTVATSGSYNDLLSKPTLGTAAAMASTAFATAAQGTLAGTAVQPGSLATVATSGSYNDLLNKPAGGVDPLLSKGNVVKLVYFTTAVSGVATNGWYYPDKTAVTLTGRLATIVWEGIASQIPVQGTGVSAFRIGDTAMVRSATL